MTVVDPMSVMVDLDLERDVLGAILEFELFDEFAASGLTSDHFYRQEHAEIFRAADDIHEDGARANKVTVAQRLREVGKFEKIGAAYLGGMGEGVARPDTVNIAYQLARLEELAATRLVHYATMTLGERLKRPTALADGAVSTHLDTLQQILERQHSPATLWLDATAQVHSHRREVQESTTAHRLSFGLKKLDEALGGVRMGEVCGILGRPGIGKTVFLTVIARAVADIAAHVVFSLEMPASQIVGRLKQNLYNKGRRQVEDATRGHLLDDDLYVRTFDRLVIVDTPSLSVSEMMRRVRQIQKGPLKHTPIRMVTIDHLGLIGGDRSLSTYDRVSVQAREIKEMAKRLECAVVLAVQVSREAGGDGSRELGLGSARDSGVVEEAMDYMIGIRRLDRSQSLSPDERAKYKDIIFAKVIKNRHDDPGMKEIAYHFLAAGMDLREDPHFEIENDDVARLAQQRSAGGRR